MRKGTKFNIEKEIMEENRKRNVTDMGVEMILPRTEPVNPTQAEFGVAQFVAANDTKHADQETVMLLSVMRDKADNRAFRHLYSCRKYIGGIIVFCKRVVRKCLKWYIEPICDQQTDFNHATVAVAGKLFNEVASANTATSDIENKLTIFESRLQDMEKSWQGWAEDLTKKINAQGEHANLLDTKGETLRKRVTCLEEEFGVVHERADYLKGEVGVQCVRIDHLEGEIGIQREQAGRMRAEIDTIREHTDRKDTEFGIQYERMNRMEREINMQNHHVERLGRALEEQRPRYTFGEIMSASQSGEDTIVAYILDSLKIPFHQCTYLDLGANHPKFMSNSYMFYRYGARGVLVEANPMLIPELEKERRGDVILNKCVAERSGEYVDFYVMNGDGLSTPEYSRALECIEKNPVLKIEQTVQTETISIPDLLEQYFREPPVLVNIDVEGNELDILCGLDLERKRPLIIIVETIPYDPNVRVNYKNEEVIAYMKSMKYAEYAFTGINSIFVDTKRLP